MRTTLTQAEKNVRAAEQADHEQRIRDEQARLDAAEARRRRDAEETARRERGARAEAEARKALTMTLALECDRVRIDANLDAADASVREVVQRGLLNAIGRLANWRYSRIAVARAKAMHGPGVEEAESNESQITHLRNELRPLIDAGWVTVSRSLTMTQSEPVNPTTGLPRGEPFDADLPERVARAIAGERAPEPPKTFSERVDPSRANFERATVMGDPERGKLFAFLISDEMIVDRLMKEGDTL